MTPLSPEHRPAWRSLPRNVWIATATSFLTDVSSEMLLNLVPLFLANVLGASTAIIGLIEGLAETTSALLKATSGWLSDKIRGRKWLAVTGYALSAVTKPLFYFAATWPMVLLIRFIDRAGKGIRTAPRDALIADSIDANRRGVAFGLHRAGDTAGAALGLVIALLIVLATGAGALTLSRETFQTLALISAVPAVIAVMVLAFGAREVRLPAHKPGQAQANASILNGRFRYFLLVMALFTLGNSSDAFLILRAQERGLNVAGILGMLISFNLIYAVAAGPLGALSDRVGRRRLLLGGWIVYGLIYIGFALAQDAAQIWLLYALYGLYYAATEGAAKAYVADLIPPESRGTAYGAFNATVGLMAFPASLLAGMLWQGAFGWTGFGPAAPFIGGAVLSLAAVILFSLQPKAG